MKLFLGLLFFLIPVVWTKYVNANYLTTKTILLYFVSSLTLLAIPNKVKVRAIPHSLSLVLASIVVYYLAHSFYTLNYSEILTVFKMLSFCFIVFFFYNLNFNISIFLKNFNYPFLLVLLSVLSVGVWQVVNFKFLQGKSESLLILGTFGNVNMFAEFLILVFPLVFIWLRTDTKLTPQYFKLFILGVLLFLVFYTRSRSAWMGLLFWILILGRNHLRKSEWLIFSISFVLFFWAHFLWEGPDKAVAEIKLGSLETRASLYKASFELLTDNPFGIRPGQFVNEIVPYLISQKIGPSEFSYYDQPHSEFLKWGIQFGWPFLLLSVVALMLICKLLVSEYLKLSKPYSSESNLNELQYAEKKEESYLFIGFGLVLLPQLLFQFPFENPASLVLIAFVFGMFLSRFPVRNKSINIKFVIPFLGIVSFVGIVNSFLFGSSVFLESHYATSPDIMNLACRIYPMNFKTCHLKNRALFDIKNIAAFRQEFKTDFQNNPFFCDNLKLLPEYFNYSNSEKKTCESILLYAEIFKEQQTFKVEAMPPCQRYSVPVKFNNPKQFNEEFRQWFAQNR